MAASYFFFAIEHMWGSTYQASIDGCYLFTYNYSTYWCVGQIIASYHNYCAMCLRLVRCPAANDTNPGDLLQI